jgi:O-antigen/teichoic acid export membrane protein
LNTTSGFVKFASNAAWMIGGRLFKALLGFAIGVFVARYLGPGRFGVLNYAIGLAMLFSIFCSVGLDGIMVRELVNDKENHDNLLGSSMALRLLGTSVAIGLVIAFLLLTKADCETWILTLICTVSFFFRAADSLRNLYEATVQAKVIVLVETVQTLLSSGLRIYFIAIKGDIFLFALCWLSEWIFIAIGLIVYYLKNTGSISKWNSSFSTVKHLFRESAPLLLSAMAVVVYQQIDKVMLKNMLIAHGNEQVGYYSAAVRIIPFVIIIPQMMAKALAPALMSSLKRDLTEYKLKAQLFMDMMVWIGVLLSVSLYFLANPIMSLYGDEYAASVSLLKIMTAKGLFISMSAASAILIIGEGVQKCSVLRNLAGCILNIFLNYLWIPKWGATGSAWATIFSYGTGAFLIHFFIPSFRQIFFIQFRSIVSGPGRLGMFCWTVFRHRVG